MTWKKIFFLKKIMQLNSQFIKYVITKFGKNRPKKLKSSQLELAR